MREFEMAFRDVAAYLIMGNGLTARLALRYGKNGGIKAYISCEEPYARAAGRLPARIPVSGKTAYAISKAVEALPDGHALKLALKSTCESAWKEAQEQHGFDAWQKAQKQHGPDEWIEALERHGFAVRKVI